MRYSLALLMVAALVIASPVKRLQMSNGVGKLPALGWNSWNAYHGDINASIIEETAQLFINLGLKDVGYEYVNMDDYWGDYAGRGSNGELRADPTKFPEGIEGVVNMIHSLGLKAGIYSSASVETCGGYPASLDHEQTDAATFAEWGIDYLKYDNCQDPSEHPGVEVVDQYDFCTPENYANEFNGNPVVNGSCAITSRTAPPGYDWTQSNTYHRYAAMSEALSAQEHEILFSLCDWGWADVLSWGGSLGSSWRVVGDIEASWVTIMGTFNQALFMSNSVDFWGHNDLDILEVGNGGLYPEECRSHFALWAAMKSPLLIGTDLASLSADRLATLKNKYLLAFNQDSVYGKPATPFNWDWSWDLSTPTARYWSGQSSSGVLVLLFNPTNDVETMTAKWIDVPELDGDGPYETTDIWTGKTSCVANGFTRSVIRHDTAGALIGRKCSSSPTNNTVPVSVYASASKGSGAASIAPLSASSGMGWNSTITAQSCTATAVSFAVVASGSAPVSASISLSASASASNSSVYRVPSLSSVRASPIVSSPAANATSTPSASPQPINQQYQENVLSTIGSLAPYFNNDTKTWQSIWGFEAATVYQDLMDYKYWTGDASQDSYGDSLLEIVTNYDLLNGVGAIDDYNDDQGWWMLSFLHAYRSYGHVEFLNQTITQFKQIVASSQLSASDAGTTPDLDGVARSTEIPATCDVAGSVYWEQTADSSINAVSTGLIAQIGAILYGITKQEGYRLAADLALNYERRVLLSSDAIIDVDSITTATCAQNGGDLCYNTGIYFDACTRLYQATGEAQYLEWATLSVTTAVGGVFGNSSSAPLVIDQGDNSADTFFSALTEYYVMIKSLNINMELQDKIKAFVKANRDYVAANDKQSNGLYSEDWVAQSQGTEWGTGSVLSLYMAAMIML